MTSDEELISTHEASEILDMTPSGVSRMVGRGHLHPVKRLPGRTGAFVFARTDVVRVADERRAAADRTAKASA